jgi:hypothetical protein
MEYHQGKLYVSSGAKIWTVNPNTGVITDMISGLPSLADCLRFPD